MYDVPSGISSDTSCTTGRGSAVGGVGAAFFREATFFTGAGGANARFAAAAFFGPATVRFLVRPRGGSATGAEAGARTGAGEGATTAAGEGATRCCPARRRFAPTWVAAIVAGTSAELGMGAGAGAGELDLVRVEEAGAGAGAGAGELEVVRAAPPEAAEVGADGGGSIAPRAGGGRGGRGGRRGGRGGLAGDAGGGRGGRARWRVAAAAAQ